MLMAPLSFGEGLGVRANSGTADPEMNALLGISRFHFLDYEAALIFFTK